MKTDAHILVDDILRHAKNQVHEAKLLSILPMLGFGKNELKEAINELVTAGHVKRITDKKSSVILLECHEAGKAPPAPPITAEFVKNLDRESFLILDIAAHAPQYDLEDIEEVLENLPGCSAGPMHAHLAPLIQSGAVHLHLGRPDAKNLAAVSPVIERRAVINLEGAIAERRVKDREQNRAALLQWLCNRCNMDPQDDIIRAYGKMDRTCMLSDEYAPLAWVDKPLPIADKATTVSAPHAIVMTLQAVRPAPGERLLVCGCKGGLIGAVAAHMVGTQGKVLCIDDNPAIVAHTKQAMAKITDLPCPVEIKQRDDITMGTEGEGAWDVIILNGSVPKIPYPLIEQLNGTRGRLLFFMREENREKKSDICYVIHKNHDVIKSETLSGFLYTAIYGRYGWDDIGKLGQLYREARTAREKAKYAIDQVRQTVAYPLARMYREAINASEQSHRYQLALKVHEVLLKYYAICCLIQADQQNCRAPAFCQGVVNIGRPSLGHWMSIITGSRECLGADAFGKILSFDLTRTLKHETVRSAFEKLSSTTGTKLPEKINLLKFFDLTTQFRNKPEHGTHLSVQDQGENAQLLLDALRIILLESRLCTELDLVYVEEVQFASKAAGHTARVHRCMGTDRQTLTWTNLDQPIEPKAVYLLDKSHHEVACLKPFIVYEQGEHKKQDLFMYVNKGEYLTYFDPDRFPAKKPEQRIDDIISAYAPVSMGSKAREAAESEFMGALKHCVRDGRLDDNEILELMSTARASGLAANDEEARAYVQDKYQSLMAGG